MVYTTITRDEFVTSLSNSPSEQSSYTGYTREACNALYTYLDNLEDETGERAIFSNDLTPYIVMEEYVSIEDYNIQCFTDYIDWEDARYDGIEVLCTFEYNGIIGALVGNGHDSILIK